VDTLTHVALGACLGELLATKKVGKKALIFGALAQSVPDIDFILSFWLEPSANALAHRGFTHSFLFAVLITPILAWAAQRGWGSTQTSFKFWFTFFGLQVLLHSVLDALNAYGTGWFEPFSHERVSFHALFVADPFFSISLGIAAFVLMISTLENKKRKQWALVSIILSLLYLGYAIMNKSHINRAVRGALAEQKINPERYFATPTPFNNWLWYVVVNSDSGSYVGYRSVFDQKDVIDFQFFPRQDSLLLHHAHTKEVHLLKRFSQGYYTVESKGDTLIFNDLRFGQMIGWQERRAGFVFHYYLQPHLENHLVLQRGRFANWDWAATQSLVERIRGTP
jgi:inner membrane protein